MPHLMEDEEREEDPQLEGETIRSLFMDEAPPQVAPPSIESIFQPDEEPIAAPPDVDALDEEPKPLDEATIRKARAMESRMKERYEQVEEEGKVKRPPRALEEETVKVPSFTEVIDRASKELPDLSGDESYRAVIKLRKDALRSAVYGDEELAKAYLYGSQEERDWMRDEIFDRIHSEHPGMLNGFNITPQRLVAKSGDFQYVVPREHENLAQNYGYPLEVRPPVKSSLKDHGTELMYQLLLDGDISWNALDRATFIQFAELYADRHPDYKNSEQFGTISKRAAELRKFMALELSEDGRLSWDVENATTMGIMEGIREFLPFSENLTVEDEEKNIRDVTRVLYHLEGVDFGVEKTVGVLAGMLGTYGAAYSRLSKMGLVRLTGKGAKPWKSWGLLAAMEGGINFAYNDEGYSLISNIFMEGDDNVPLSYVEAIAVGTVFQLGADVVRTLTKMPRKKAVLYLENKLPSMGEARGNLVSVLKRRPPHTSLAEVVQENMPKQLALPETGVRGEGVARHLELSETNIQRVKNTAKSLRQWAIRNRQMKNHDKARELYGKAQEFEKQARALEESHAFGIGVREKKIRRETAEFQQGMAAKGMPSGEPILVNERGIATLANDTERLVDDAVYEHASLLKRIRDTSPEVRAAEDLLPLIPEEISPLTAKEVKELTAQLSSARKRQLSRGRMEELAAMTPEQLAELQTRLPLMNLFDDIQKIGEKAETFGERVRMLDAARQATHGATPPHVGAAGGLTDAETHAFANIVHKEMFKFPQLAYEMGLQYGFGNLVGVASEDLDQGYLPGFLMGFMLFNPQFLRIQSGRLGIKQGGKVKTGLINKLIEPIASAAARIHPTAGKFFMKTEARMGWAAAKGVSIQRKPWEKLAAGVSKGILYKDEVAAFARQVNDEGTTQATNQWLAKLSRELYESERSTLASKHELVVDWNKAAKHRAALHKEGNAVGMEIGDLGPTYFPRSVMKKKQKAYNEAMGIDEKSFRDEAIDEFEKVNGRRATDEERIKLGNSAVNDASAGLRFAGNLGFTKKRKFEKILKDWDKFYERPWTAAVQYAEGMVYEIERRKALGSHLRATKEGWKSRGEPINPELDQSIGGLLEWLRPSTPILPAGTEIRSGGTRTTTLGKDIALDAIHGITTEERKRLAKLAHVKKTRWLDATEDNPIVIQLKSGAKKRLKSTTIVDESFLGKTSLWEKGEKARVEKLIREEEALVVPAKTEVTRSGPVTSRILEVDTPLSKAFVGEEAQLAKGEMSRLRKIANENSDRFNKISAADEDKLRHLVQQRFLLGRDEMPAWFNVMRSWTHMAHIGQFSSTATQMGDLGLTMATEGLTTAARMLGERSKTFVDDVLKKFSKGKHDKARPDNIIYSRDQFGIKLQGGELFGTGKTGRGFMEEWSGKAADTVLKYTGFKSFDSVLKDVKLNSTLKNMRKWVKGHVAPDGRVVVTKIDERFAKRFKEAFGRGNDYDDLVKAIIKKDWGNWNLRTAVLMELSKVQPVTMSNMPEAYLRAGPMGRSMYVLRTFQLTYVDNLRRAVLAKMYHGGKKMLSPKTFVEGKKQFTEGVKALGSLALFFGGVTFGVNQLKDWINGRPHDLKGTSTDAFFQTLGTGRWQVRQFERRFKKEGAFKRFPKSLVPPVLDQFYPAALSPPTAFVNDLMEIADGEREWSEAETLKHVPLVGRPYTDRFGAGAVRREEEKAKERKQTAKKNRAALRGFEGLDF